MIGLQRKAAASYSKYFKAFLSVIDASIERQAYSFNLAGATVNIVKSL